MTFNLSEKILKNVEISFYGKDGFFKSEVIYSKDVKEFIILLKAENLKSIENYSDGLISREQLLEELSFINNDKLVGKFFVNDAKDGSK